MGNQNPNQEALSSTLHHDTLNGIVDARSKTGSVIAIAAPYRLCEELLNRTEADGSGVYIFSRMDELTGCRHIYVGEASNVGDRIRPHIQSGKMKNYTRFVIIVSCTNHPITCEKDLESWLIDRVKVVDWTNLDNGKGSKEKKKSQEDDIYAHNLMKFVEKPLPALGFDILEPCGGFDANNDTELNVDVQPKPRPETRPKSRSVAGSRSSKAPSGAGSFRREMFCLNQKGDIRREISWKNGKYWLGKGALIRSIDKHEEEVDAEKPWIKRRRQEEKRLLIDKTGQLKTSTELGFDTLSAAASFIVGASRSSKAFWREHRPKGEESESSQTHVAVHCNSDELFCRSKKGDVDARIRRTKDGYMLIKGSIIRSIDQDTEVQNASMPWTERRNEEKANLKRDQKGHIITAKDIKFDTLSAAACFVAGRRRSSNQFWHKRESGN